jgi:hypothetical protein
MRKTFFLFGLKFIFITEFSLNNISCYKSVVSQKPNKTTFPSYSAAATDRYPNNNLAINSGITEEKRGFHNTCLFGFNSVGFIFLM